MPSVKINIDMYDDFGNKVGHDLIEHAIEWDMNRAIPIWGEVLLYTMDTYMKDPERIKAFVDRCKEEYSRPVTETPYPIIPFRDRKKLMENTCLLN